MDKQIAGRIVLVSVSMIGSELCRQVISLNPDTPILLDQSEFALFEIHSESARRIDEVALIQPVNWFQYSAPLKMSSTVCSRYL